MAYDFPNAPTTGQTTSSPGGVYKWDGTKWAASATPSSPGGTVTNVATGTGLTGGPITTTGTIALSAPVSVANGGTGATTAGAALTSLGAAPLASPTFTGTPSLPTGTTGITQTAGNSSTALATTAFVATSFAPLAAPVFTGDAKAVTPAYGDNDTSISTTAFVQSAVAPVANNVGRNLLTNGTFVTWQRGTGAFTNGYSADRWMIALSSDTVSVNRVTFGDSQRATVGDESMTYGLIAAVTGNAAAGAFSFLAQPIEGVRRLSGKTIIVSFWAYATTGTSPKLGVGMRQYMGTGGSPSAPVDLAGQAVTLALNTPQKYSITFNMPSLSGATLGTNGDDYNRLSFWFSCGATNATMAGNPGVQTANFVLWGIQLEIGSVATPLDAGGSAQQILAECQRFFQTGGAGSIGSAPSAGGRWSTQISYPVVMRASPTVALANQSYSNASGAAVYATNAGYLSVTANMTAVGDAAVTFNYTASADL